MSDQEAPEAAVPEKSKRVWPLRIAKIVAGILAALLVLVALVVVGINTGPGRDFVKDQIEALEFENGLAIGIEEIDGSLYGEMTLRGFTLADPEGVFLRSPELAMEWNPAAFINNHIDIESLTAQTVVLERLPALLETAPTDDPLLPDYDIDIGTMKVDEFIAEAPVSGERRVATFAGDVRIADRRAQINLDASTLGTGGQAGGDRLALLLDAVPDDNKLALKLDLQAPENGMIAALAGLTEPLDLQLDGQGDWANWSGDLLAQLGGANIADVELTAQDGTFGVTGPLRLASFAPASTAELLGEFTQVDMSAALEERAATIEGRAFSDAFNLTLNGQVDLSDNSFDDLRAAFVLLKPSAIAPSLRGSGLRALLALDGAFAAPEVDYQINANTLVMNDMGLQNLRAAGNARVDAERILIPVTATASRVTGLDTVAGGTLTDIRMDGDIAVQGTRILSDNMRIRSDRVDANVILLADAATGLYTGAIDGKIDNYRVESVGTFNIETDVDLTTDQGGYALAGVVRARSTSIANDSVREFIGGNLVGSSDVAYGSDGIARFSNLRMTAPLLRVTGGQGTYSVDGQFDITATGISEPYGPVGLELTGTIANPKATVLAASPGLGIGLAQVRAQISGNNGNYSINATGQTDYGVLTANFTVATASGPLKLVINTGDLAGINFSGEITQSAAGPFLGQLDASGRGLGGIVRLGAQGKYQTALLNMRAKGTVLPGPANLRIGSAIIDAEVVLYDSPRVLADIQLANTDYGALNINAMRALVDYRDGSGTAEMLMEGTSGVPFRISANADFTPELWRANLQGRVRGIRIRTASTARIIPGENSYKLLPTTVDLGRGSIRLAGTYGQGIKVQSRLESVNLSLLNAFAPGLGVGGSATGSLDFTQANPDAFPSADARMTIANFTRSTAAVISRSVDVSMVGQLQASGGAARAVIRRQGAVIGRMNVGLTPLPPGRGAWTTRLMQAPLTGGVRYNGPAETLFSLGGQADQSLSGAIGVAADFTGRVAQPQLAGIVRGNNLTYENQIYGTRLSKIALRGDFSGDQLKIGQFDAVAGDGTVKATGTVSLASDSGYPMNIKVQLDNARLARSDALSATATGTLALTKTAGSTALLAGTIRLPETRYQVVRQAEAEVAELSGVRFKPRRGRTRITGDEAALPVSSLLEQLRLDIDMEAPERLYVSGMGLESEWSADLKISGTSAAPRMSGSVNLVRGTLGFAGRSFDLTEGVVRFNGGRTLDPSIVLAATENIDGVTVSVDVSGQAYNPQIAFSSTPGLPQDEIVSRILFGNSVGNLSAIQAVQLAASLNSLRGTGGGLNPLGKLRSATGVDRLRILGADETTGRGTSLAAGQYITDDIYIEVITDARGFTATQLEISLTPTLSVLSQAGGAIGTNVNVQYRKNY